MDFMPYEGNPRGAQRRLSRVVLATLVVAGVAAGAVSVLSRPHAQAGTSAASVRSVTSEPAEFGRPANADQDRGPGEVESDLAIVPEAGD
jgi:hypothetical protein